MFDLLLQNGFAVSGSGTSLLDIAVEGGKIVAMEKNISEPAKRTIDCSNKHILPGMIDAHVHCREPGAILKENFESASHAAAAGGVTTIIDMPNTSPPTITYEALEEKRELAKRGCMVDYGFHFGVTDDNLDEVKRAENVIGFKCYLGKTTGNILIRDLKNLEKTFATRKGIFVIHLGNDIETVLTLAKKHSARVHITHISTAKELEILKSARSDLVTADVTPHHLFLNEHEVEKQGSFVKVAPLLGRREDQEALWQGIDEGLILMIASDHAPHLKYEKELPFAEAPAGVPGLETTLPLLLNMVSEKRLTIEKVIELIAENPAKIFGMQHTGKLEIGYDANIAVVDLNLEKEVRNENLFTKCGWSPFHGWKLKGWPIITVVNGKVVFENGRIVKSPPFSS